MEFDKQKILDWVSLILRWNCAATTQGPFFIILELRDTFDVVFSNTCPIKSFLDGDFALNFTDNYNKIFIANL